MLGLELDLQRLRRLRRQRMRGGRWAGEQPGPGRWKGAHRRSCHGEATAVDVGRHGIFSDSLEET